jgi:predicted transcriptional regulator
VQKILRDGVKRGMWVSQSPRDHILWILTNNGGKMERSRLRAHTGMRYALLNPILDEFVKEGRIRVTEDLVSLINR